MGCRFMINNVYTGYTENLSRKRCSTQNFRFFRPDFWQRSWFLGMIFVLCGGYAHYPMKLHHIPHISTKKSENNSIVSSRIVSRKLWPKAPFFAILRKNLIFQVCFLLSDTMNCICLDSPRHWQDFKPVSGRISWNVEVLVRYWSDQPSRHLSSQINRIINSKLLF